MITDKEHLAFPSNPVHLASILTGKTVRYKNAKRSTVTSDGVRVFKIKDVEDVFTSNNSDVAHPARCWYPVSELILGVR